MELYLQFAHNMQVLCRELITEWKGGTVVMSPRDCKPSEDDETPGDLEKHATSIRDAGAAILLDPQFYVPEADHKVLTSHGYWPEKYDSGEFWKEDTSDYSELIKNLGDLNNKLDTAATIVPGTLADVVSDDWLTRQEIMLGEARKQMDSDRELYATVALSADAAKNSEQVHAILEAAAKWDVEGIYLICEHPDHQYLVEQDGWISNILDLCAGLRLRGLKVIVGYANQQMVAVACAGATAIAAGSHKMKRQFDSSDMMAKDDDEIQKQATWYYCPQAYSEFQIARLDSAQLQKVLEKLRPPRDMRPTHADILFAGAQPSSVGFKHKLSFKHYLSSLRRQAAVARKPTFEETVKAYRQSVDAAEVLLKELETKRIRGEERSFLSVVDPTHVAISLLEEDRGAMLRRAWSKF